MHHESQSLIFNEAIRALESTKTVAASSSAGRLKWYETSLHPAFEPIHGIPRVGR